MRKVKINNLIVTALAAITGIFLGYALSLFNECWYSDGSIYEQSKLIEL